MHSTNAETDTFMATRLGSGPWDAAIESDRTAAKTMAADSINQLAFRGTKTVTTQPDAFPRDGIPGTTDGTVPENIKKAEHELALYYLECNGDEASDRHSQLYLESESLGGSAGESWTRTPDTAPEHVCAGIMSHKAWLFIKPYLAISHDILLKRTS